MKILIILLIYVTYASCANFKFPKPTRDPLAEFKGDPDLEIPEEDEDKPAPHFQGDAQAAKITAFENKNNIGKGKTRYTFETQNGIAVTQVGKLKDDKTYIVSGSYSYTGADGKRYRVRYTADEKGYHPMTELELDIPELTTTTTTTSKPYKFELSNFEFPKLKGNQEIGQTNKVGAQNTAGNKASYGQQGVGKPVTSDEKNKNKVKGGPSSSSSSSSSSLGNNGAAGINVQSSKTSAGNKGAGTNSGTSSGINSGPNSSINSGANSNKNSGLSSGINSGTSSKNSGINSGVTSNKNSGVNSGVTSNKNSGVNSGVTSNKNSGVNSGVTSNKNSGLSSGVNPSKNSGSIFSKNSGIDSNKATNSNSNSNKQTSNLIKRPVNEIFDSHYSKENLSLNDDSLPNIKLIDLSPASQNPFAPVKGTNTNGQQQSHPDRLYLPPKGYLPPKQLPPENLSLPI